MTEAQPEPRAPLNITALVNEAASKSGLIWIDVPGDRAWPAWHAWDGERLWVVAGPGEQTLPWMPDRVDVIFRSKDSGGRLLTVTAEVREVTVDGPDWATAVGALTGTRLNAVDDQVTRWSQHCVVRSLTPFGAPVETPGSYAAGSGAAPPVTSAATTSRWRPWHLGGRPQRRRRLRG